MDKYAVGRLIPRRDAVTDETARRDDDGTVGLNKRGEPAAKVFGKGGPQRGIGSQFLSVWTNFGDFDGGGQVFKREIAVFDAHVGVYKASGY